MPTPTTELIEKLCEDWCVEKKSLPENQLWGQNPDQFRLLPNGVVFHELNHEELCAAIIGLSKVQLLPDLRSYTHQDHYALWGWCGELLLNNHVFLGYDMPPAPEISREIQSLYVACLHAMLVHSVRPSATQEQFDELNRMENLLSRHRMHFIEKSFLIVAYLAFPLLESIIKRACASYVTLNGDVLTAFDVPGGPGRPGKPVKDKKFYKPTGATGNKGTDQCSSLRDLLFLHHKLVAPPRLAALIDSFRAHLTSLDATQDPFDLIYQWRNQTLHGKTNFHTIGATIMNFSLLISIFEIEENFEQNRLLCVAVGGFAEEMIKHRGSRSFYPPY